MRRSESTGRNIYDKELLAYQNGSKLCHCELSPLGRQLEFVVNLPTFSSVILRRKKGYPKCRFFVLNRGGVGYRNFAFRMTGTSWVSFFYRAAWFSCMRITFNPLLIWRKHSTPSNFEHIMCYNRQTETDNLCKFGAETCFTLTLKLYSTILLSLSCFQECKLFQTSVFFCHAQGSCETVSRTCWFN